MAAPTTIPSTADTRLPSMFSAITTRRVVVLAIALAVMLFGLPFILGSFWMQITMQAVIYSAVALGLGLLVGRAGMFSLCQIPLFAAGAWIALRLGNATNLPFPILLLITGVLTGLLGAFIGIPALRLSGLYLALITLMGAGALTLLLQNNKFPNGGGGFWGFDKSLASGATSLDRPSIATGDIGYYRYVVIVVALLFLFVTWHIKGKPGRAWAAIRQSQVTAVAAGVHTTLYKMWAFALSAFVTGVAGALLAAGPGGVSVNQFPVEQSIVLLAVVLMGGVFNIWGALLAGFFLRVLPQLLDQKLGLSGDILTILFGIGVMQVLLTAPGGAVEDLAKLGRKIGGFFTGNPPELAMTDDKPVPDAAPPPTISSATDDGVIA
jgi:branched-chain amino acid transport system permease protein